MPIRFSPEGPVFPESLVDDLLAGEVVFLCGAGISAPQLRNFRELVEACHARLKVPMSAAATIAFEIGRYEEVLGALGRQLLDPTQLTTAVVACLQPDGAPQLEHHRTILRLSRGLDNRCLVVTTNFDTLLEKAMCEGETNAEVARQSLAGQDLPLPGSYAFSGIIHLHGRLEDATLGLVQTPLVLTSADYGDAYMRSGWASRFLFDLCRSKTVVLLGYSASDAPVRYFLNVLAADRERFVDVKPVYAFDTSAQKGGWETLDVTPLLYLTKPDALPEGRHLSLWDDLGRLADLIEAPGSTQSREASSTLRQSFLEVGESEKERLAWYFQKNQSLWELVVEVVEDPLWFDFLRDRKLWNDRHAAVLVVQWVLKDLESIPRFNVALKWIKILGSEFALQLTLELSRVLKFPGSVWFRAWHLLAKYGAPRIVQSSASPYLVKSALSSDVVLMADISNAIELLTPGPVISVQTGARSIGLAHEAITELFHILSFELTLPDEILMDDDLVTNLLEALQGKKSPILMLQLVTAQCRGCLELAQEFDYISDTYDPCNASVPSVEHHVQNQNHDGLVVLVQLMSTLLASAARADRQSTRCVVELWRHMPGLLGVRLWLHALRSKELFTSDEAISSLASVGTEHFWGQQRELALVIRDRVGEASSSLVESLEQRILGEGRTFYSQFGREESKADWWEAACDLDVWLRLSMLEEAGRLSQVGMCELREIQSRHEHLNRPVSERDFFGFYSEGMAPIISDPQVIQDAASENRMGVALESLQSPDIRQRLAWRGYCRLEPMVALDTLRREGWTSGSSALWKEFLLVVASPAPDNLEKLTSVAVETFSALKTAPDGFFAHLIHPLAMLYWLYSPHRGPDIFCWWSRLFELAVTRDQGLLVFDEGEMRDAPSSPGGRLAWALLNECVHTQKGNGRPTDEQLKKLVTAAEGTGRQGAMARAVLTLGVESLLVCGASEAIQSLGTALNAEDAEADALRNLLVTRVELSPASSKTFKNQILRGVKQLPVARIVERSVAAKLVKPALSAVSSSSSSAATEDWGISLDDVANALCDSSPEVRVAVAALLSHKAKETPSGERDVAWQKTFRPLLERIWPKQKDLHSQTIGEQLAGIVIHAGNAFPQALEFMSAYITRADTNGSIDLIKNAKVHQDFPREVLRLLWQLYGHGQENKVYGLRPILRTIAERDPTLAKDRRLQTLDLRAATPY